MFVVWLRSVKQTNHITANANDVSFHTKGPVVACGANNEGFLAFVSHRTNTTKNRLCSRAKTMTDEKKNVNESPNTCTGLETNGSQLATD